MEERKIVQEATQLENNKKIIKKQHGKKVQNEINTRKYILELAQLQGCYGEAKIIMDKYDKLLIGCTNPIEKKHIAIMGVAELHKLLNVQGALVINGVEILPAIGEIRDIIY
jgi:hypothetical protein